MGTIPTVPTLAGREVIFVYLVVRTTGVYMAQYEIDLTMTALIIAHESCGASKRKACASSLAGVGVTVDYVSRLTVL